jgi:hypothetical protein
MPVGIQGIRAIAGGQVSQMGKVTSIDIPSNMENESQIMQPSDDILEFESFMNNI